MPRREPTTEFSNPPLLSFVASGASAELRNLRRVSRRALFQQKFMVGHKMPSPLPRAGPTLPTLAKLSQTRLGFSGFSCDITARPDMVLLVRQSRDSRQEHSRSRNSFLLRVLSVATSPGESVISSKAEAAWRTKRMAFSAQLATSGDLAPRSFEPVPCFLCLAFCRLIHRGCVVLSARKPFIRSLRVRDDFM
jgi:hypothetical protein